MISDFVRDDAQYALKHWKHAPRERAIATMRDMLTQHDSVNAAYIAAFVTSNLGKSEARAFVEWIVTVGLL